MFYVNDEPESKFLYIETIKLYCIVTVILKCVCRLSERNEEKEESGKSVPIDKNERETAKVSLHAECCHCFVLCPS